MIVLRETLDVQPYEIGYHFFPLFFSLPSPSPTLSNLRPLRLIIPWRWRLIRSSLDSMHVSIFHFADVQGNFDKWKSCSRAAPWLIFFTDWNHGILDGGKSGPRW